MITLSTFKDRLDIIAEWARRGARNKFYSLEFLRGVIEGTHRVLLDFSAELEYPEMIKPESAQQEKDLVGYIEIFDYFYPIYLDDYGQSFYTLIDGKEYSFGTYNTDIAPDLVGLVLGKLTQDILVEIEEIYNGKM